MKFVFSTKTFMVGILLLFTATCFILPAEAQYSTGFNSIHTKITAPTSSGLACNGKITVEGTSDLEQVWFCLRAPGGEIVTYSAEVKEGKFNKDLWLKFGPGKYVVWAGDNPKNFDGSIRFEVNNILLDDLRFLCPSNQVDCDNPLILQLSEAIILPEMTQMEKLKAIHDWVTANIVYDYQAYLWGSAEPALASHTLTKKMGTCKDYSCLVAALARAAGLQARIICGEANYGDSPYFQSHAWNEVMVDGRWVPVDSTWDAGYIINGDFVPNPSKKFFDPDPVVFAQTHRPTNCTLN